MPSKSKKEPYMPLYVGDYKKNVALRSCSLAARGLWAELQMSMWEAPRRGFLEIREGQTPTDSQLCRQVSAFPEELAAAFEELEDAGVIARTKESVIYDPEMIERERLRAARAAGGKKGGNPALKDKGKVGRKVNLDDNQGDKPPATMGKTKGPTLSGQVSSSQLRPVHGRSKLNGSSGSGARPVDPGGDQPSIYATRSRQEPPEGVPPAHWREACDCADLVEGVEFDVPVRAYQGVERALGFAMLFDYLEGRGRDWDWVKKTMVCLVANRERTVTTREVLRNLRLFPNGAYPNTSAGGAGPAPSQVERVYKELKRLGAFRKAALG